MNLIEITNDLFDIASRLKSVNAYYKLYFNTESDRYEVHNISQHGSTLAFVVPYDELDARTVEFARMTKVENAKALFKSIERHNQKLEEEQQYNTRQNILSKLDSVL